MGDGRAELGLDVVADDGDAALFEAVAPVSFAGKEHGDAVDHGAAGVEYLLDVPLGGLLAAHGQVVDDHIHLTVPEDAGDVGGRVVGLPDEVGDVTADAVVGHSPLHLDAGVGNVGEFYGVVRLGENGF